MPVIETQGLKKTYGSGQTRVEALRGVDLTIHTGEMVAIIGPSGCGKSSLLALLGGVDLPTEGRVLLEDTDLASLSDDQRTIARRQRIGFIFQSFNLLPTLTAAENVALPLELDGVSRAESMQRALSALSSLEMEARAGHLPSEMSGGEQQRVAIARALVIQPALLLADEPTGNLDTANSQRTVALLKKLVASGDQTIVVVTHDMEVAQQATRIIRLRDGMIEHDGPPNQETPELDASGQESPDGNTADDTSTSDSLQDSKR
ncbi:ABC transporter ATP-binding protein [Stieleria varia]|uniref:Lipoprotein-releasing system ATP-binding protein LolD n=1 Tax=Stieleria varia TaxID=2528005 RepID=A0A5C5ZUT6_9BACT|nr:ABC transporter ATP-binding protein [Stieleria varia]TWT91282.1 Lipoprotein-releasing system ATP-binding protein LolD [Stieleria varia]